MNQVNIEREASQTFFDMPLQGVSPKWIIASIGPSRTKSERHLLIQNRVWSPKPFSSFAPDSRNGQEALKHYCSSTYPPTHSHHPKLTTKSLSSNLKPHAFYPPSIFSEHSNLAITTTWSTCTWGRLKQKFPWMESIHGMEVVRGFEYGGLENQHSCFRSYHNTGIRLDHYHLQCHHWRSKSGFPAFYENLNNCDLMLEKAQALTETYMR